MSEERRRYFRVDDTVGLSYRKISTEEARAFSERSNEHGANFDLASNFDNRIQTLLEACRVQNPVAAELIDLMNKKINFVIRQIDVDSEILQKIAYELKQVNVSACGLAFACDEALSRGETLQLDLFLQPGDLHVVALAEVVACEKIDAEEDVSESNYFVRLNFLDVNHHDQELLIQHVVKRQSAVLKAQRREREI